MIDQQLKINQVEVDNLHFDRSNPRLAEYGIKDETTDEEIIEILWEAMDVLELVQSISASGFFPHEALIIASEGGSLIVIEGNRRLAALKLLRDPTFAASKGWAIPTLDAKSRQRLDTVPAILSDRIGSWRYLGFKHVNGPAKWTSFAKAKYIGHVHNTFKIPLSEIAAQIGDRHNTVQRLYRGLMVLEQSERMGVFDRDDRYRQKLAFSHLYTGLDYPGISEFVELTDKEDETPNPVPPFRKKELGELMLWLYGSRRDRQEPLVQTQNPDLRRLAVAVSKKESLSALRSGIDLGKAFELSEPPQHLFEEALLASKRQLTTARAYLTTGDDGSEALLRLAGTVAELAADIYDELERKRRSNSKRSFKTDI